ncbi:MAG: PAS domain S-box protein [Labilithrix sp.]
MTERDGSLSALAASEEHLRLFVQNAPAGLAMFDRDMRYLAASARYAELYRLHVPDLVGQLHVEVFPDLPQRWKDSWQRCLGGAVERAKDDPFPRADGSLDYVDWEIRPWRNAAGEIGGVVLLSEVVTDRRRAAAALSRSEERYRALFDRSPFGIAELAGEDGTIVRANAQLGAILGLPIISLHGRPLVDLVVAADHAALREDLTVVRTGRVSYLERELHLALPRGRTALVCVTCTALEEANAVMVTVADMTKRRSVSGKGTTPPGAVTSEAEARWTAMVQASPLAMVMTAAGSGRVLDANPAFEQLLGYDRGALVGRTAVELGIIGADFRREFAEELRANGRGARSALRVRAKDGGERIIEVAISADTLRGEDCFVTIARDVTEQRRAEEELEAREQAMLAAFENAPIGLAFGIPGESRLAAVNRRVCEMLGYTREVLLTKSIVELSHPDDIPATREVLKRFASAEEDEVSTVKRFVRKDGSTLECEVRIALIPAERGRPRRTVIGLTDLTDRRRAEAAMAKSEERYRELIEQLDAPIVSIDLDGIITYANPAMATYGYAPSDLIGQPASILTRPEDRAEIAALREEVFRDHAPCPRELIILDRSGKPRPVRCARRAIVRDGKVVGLTRMLTDLTPQREAEEQLRAAQRMEAVGRLAGGVAHDFNNLLTVILAYTDIARSELADHSPTRECLDEVLNAGKRAEGLTRQLLAFSRKQVMVLQPLSIEKAVGGVASMLRRLIGEDVRLEVSIPAELPLVEADLGQLELVLMNLAINSRDAMPDGGTITIEAHRATLDASAAAQRSMPAGPCVELVVRDDGMGMNEETRLRIFEPFFTTKEVGKGTGLGLSTVYGIVKQFGGEISVESTPGRGTTFRIHLPALAEGTMRSASTPAVTKTNTPLRTGHELILVVEDESGLRRVLRRILTNAGYRVLVCGTPSEALEVCRGPEADIDLVLTDVVMPEMNGRELTQRLRELKPNVPVVFMSGYTDEKLERLDVLEDNFIRKPFVSEALRAVVRTVLDRAG